MAERSRSRSPARRAPRENKGFRWKEKRPDENNDDRRGSGRPREYRNRSPPRDHGYGRDQDRSRPPRRDDPAPKDKPDGEKKDKKAKKDKKDKKATAAAIKPGEELIVVHINDRLGTKTAIPCLPSDTIAQLKLMIAARIGRESGQIMLRRQGERPFKDVLSLEDYGISNGVQLDLEVDTGD